MTLVAGAAVVLAGPAGAGAPWSVVPSASPAGAPSGDLRDVACPTPTSCFAVGDFQNNAGLHLLAEHWDGASWSVMSVPYTGGFLQSIACPTATTCMAVGGAGGAMHAARWNGTTWSITPFADAGTGSAVHVAAVACASAASCVAVGARGNSTSSTFIEQWNGTAWSLAASPNVDGADNQLGGVSCTSATFCVAVGSAAGNIPTPQTLVEEWDGTSWSIVAGPDPGAGAPDLNAVSCTSDSSCFAVGSSSDGVTQQTLIETWDGTAWSVVASPSVDGGANTLSAVSCSSDASCFAVGDPVERWDGASWSIASISTLDPKFPDFRSVECASDTSCVALATGSSSQVVERWNGTSWSAATGPLLGVAVSNTTLDSVSCASATACFAVGNSTDAAANAVPLIERPAGSTWSVVAGPHASGNSLSSVSCPSATTCFAVGSRLSENRPQTLVERWNGTAWSTVPSGNVTRAVKGLTPNTLTGVSCSSPANCFAVGYSRYFSVRTVIEHWDGTAWTIVPSPNLSTSKTAQSLLVSVSCASATSCTAVGRSSSVTSNQPSSFRTLIERWNGKAWAIVPSPNSVSGTGELSSVSCAAATVCVAVGDAYRFSSRLTLVETWNGKAWARVASADPAASTHSALTGVSCVSTASCVAVGTQAPGSGPTSTLVKILAGGRWTNGAAAAPAGARNSALSAVSCTATTTCVAVGGFDTNGSPLTLVERHA